MIFVLSMSIQLLSSSLANIMHTIYIQAIFPHVPLPTTRIREESNTDQKHRR